VGRKRRENKASAVYVSVSLLQFSRIHILEHCKILIFPLLSAEIVEFFL